MALTFIPLVLKGLDLQDPKQLQSFQRQVCDFLNAISTAPGLSIILNGPALLNESAIAPGSLNTSAFTHVNVTTLNGSTDCTGATFITGSFNMTVASTMTLNNVSDASIFDFRIVNNSGGSLLLKIAANRPGGGGAYTVFGLSALQGAETDMTGTGFTFPTGNAIYLTGIAQSTAGIINLGYL